MWTATCLYPLQIEPDAYPGEDIAAHYSRSGRGRSDAHISHYWMHLVDASIDYLAKVSLLIEQTDSHNRHTKIAGGFEAVAWQDSESPGVNQQRLAQPKPLAEVRHIQWHGGISLREPAGFFQIFSIRHDLLV
jgi:hypothetical protein